MENAILNLAADQEQMVWLIDFQGWTLASTSVKATRETARVLQDYYPERLALGILYNPPRIFESFSKVTIWSYMPILSYEFKMMVAWHQQYIHQFWYLRYPYRQNEDRTADSPLSHSKLHQQHITLYFFTDPVLVFIHGV